MLENLEVFDKVRFTEGVSKKLERSYVPVGVLGNSDTIIITINSADHYLLPYESQLKITGVITQTDAAHPVEFYKRSMPFLFREMVYVLNEVEVDRVRDVGITFQLKNILSNSDADWGFYMQTVSADKKAFSVEIPLRMLFGFMDDYKRVIWGAKHELRLSRSGSDIDCYKGAAGAVAQAITINTMEWIMPHMELDDEVKLRFRQKISRGIPLEIGYRKWELHELPSLRAVKRDVWSVKSSTQLEKPRFVIVALQSGTRRNSVTGDATMFDHADIQDIRVFLNSDRHPNENMNLDFDKTDFSRALYKCRDFSRSYYGQAIKIDLDFESQPIFVFDVSKQNETLRSGSVDLKIEFDAKNAFPGNLKAYCLILHDSIIDFTPLTGAVHRRV